MTISGAFVIEVPRETNPALISVTFDSTWLKTTVPDGTLETPLGPRFAAAAPGASMFEVMVPFGTVSADPACGANMA